MELLKEYYNQHFRKEDSIEWEELSPRQIEMLELSTGFNLYVTKLLLDRVFNEFATTIEVQTGAIKEAAQSIEQLSERLNRILDKKN